jgi:hypothetical protein
MSAKGNPGMMQKYNIFNAESSWKQRFLVLRAAAS